MGGFDALNGNFLPLFLVFFMLKYFYLLSGSAGYGKKELK
jgi:hypothetical protein